MFSSQGLKDETFLIPVFSQEVIYRIWWTLGVDRKRSTEFKADVEDFKVWSTWKRKYSRTGNFAVEQFLIDTSYGAATSATKVNYDGGKTPASHNA